MSKAIKDYLPEKESLVIVQGRVEKSIADEVKRALKARNLTWNAFLDACCRKYLEELKSKK